MTLIEKVEKIAQEKFEKVKAIREHLHSHPELSFEEYNTSEYVKNCLSEMGIQYKDGYVKTGIVAKIVGNKPGKTRALRSELDALPINELNEVAYKSTIANKMHACGHDVHSACLLGAAMILNECKEELEGTVLFVFQPGEELLPGGASLMLKEGIFEEVKPDHIIAQHVFPEMEAGKVGLCSGQYMASSDELYITVKGKGGHGALPHTTVDTILVASHIITSLQSVVSRNSNPIVPSVLTIGKINSVGGATNVIPDEVRIEGTFRTLDEDWRRKAHNIIERIIKDTASSFGASADIEIRHGYPCLNNDPLVTGNVKERLVEILGKDNVMDLPKRMTSEDFAYYSQTMPACFYRLGVGNEAKGIKHGIHTPYFDIDSEALSVGMKTMAYLALTV